MGILDTVIGGLLGGGGSSPLQGILGSLLGNAGGAGGLLDKLRQSGHGEQVDSWIGGGANQPIQPGALRDALGQNQVNTWSQQTGMGQDDLLHQLSQLIPHAVDRMTPNNTMPPENQQGGQQAGGSPFDGPGMP